MRAFTYWFSKLFLSPSPLSSYAWVKGERVMSGPQHQPFHNNLPSPFPNPHRVHSHEASCLYGQQEGWPHLLEVVTLHIHHGNLDY